MVKISDKKEIKERLDIIFNIIKNNENLDVENIKSIRGEIQSINSIKRKANIFNKKEVGEYITEETFNLLKSKLHGKSKIYKNYVIEIFESLL